MSTSRYPGTRYIFSPKGLDPRLAEYSGRHYVPLTQREVWQKRSVTYGKTIRSRWEDVGDQAERSLVSYPPVRSSCCHEKGSCDCRPAMMETTYYDSDY